MAYKKFKAGDSKQINALQKAYTGLLMEGDPNQIKRHYWDEQPIQLPEQSYINIGQQTANASPDTLGPTTNQAAAKTNVGKTLGSIGKQLGQALHDALPATLSLLNSVIPTDFGANKRVKEERNVSDPYAWGTGSSALMNNGGKLKLNTVAPRKGVLQNPDGTYSTHLLESANVNNTPVVYPTLFQNADSSWYSAKDPYMEAKNRQEVIKFKTDEEAKKFAEGSWKLRRGGKIKVTYDSPENDPAFYTPKLREIPSSLELSSKPVVELPNPIAAPPIRNRRSISFERLFNRDRTNSFFSPIFHGNYTSQEVDEQLRALPQDFNGVPVLSNRTELDEYWTSSGADTQYWGKARNGIGLTPNNSPVPLNVEGNQYQPLSTDTIEFGGNLHKNGGTQIQYGQNQAEVEKGESAFIDHQQNLRVMGNLKVPGTSTKFKDAVKDIAKEEKRVDRIGAQALKALSTDSGSEAVLTNSTAKVFLDATVQRGANLAMQKELLARIQDAMNATKTKLKNGGTVPKTTKLQDGGRLYSTPGSDSNYWLITTVREKARKYGIDPDVFERLIQTESNFNPQAKSSAGAKGIAQFMPATAREMGLDPKKLQTTDPDLIEQQIEASAKYLQNQINYFGDVSLGIMAYNRGRGNIERDLKKISPDGKRESVTGDSLIEYYSNLPKKSAGITENLNYIQKISPWLQSGSADPIGSINNPIQLDEVAITPEPIGSSQSEPMDTTSLESTEKTGFTVLSPVEQGNTVAQGSTQPSPAGMRNRLSPIDFLGELRVLGDTPDYVEGQYYRPQYMAPYQISMQDRINENNATFRAMERQLQNVPEALGAIAAQRYQANNQVMADQFRTNQTIMNEILNRNVDTSNQASLINLELADKQFDRQTRARAITEDRKLQALQSVSSKINQNRQLNRNYEMMENLAQFRQGTDGQLHYIGQPQTFTAQPQTNPGMASRVTTDQYGNEKTVQHTQPQARTQQQQATTQATLLNNIRRLLNI